MFVIFGFDESKPEIVVSNQEKFCDRCFNTNYWVLTKHQSQFSVFFIPLFPVKSKYYFSCPICNNGEKITADTYNRMINKQK